MVHQKQTFIELLQKGCCSEFIQFSAIKVEGQIYTGHSHVAALAAAILDGVDESAVKSAKTGYLTNESRFVLAEEASKIAEFAGQSAVSVKDEINSSFYSEAFGNTLSSLRLLSERMNYDQLFAYSEPKRVLRSRTVRGPALNIEAFKDSMYYYFNFKSFPSTTGSRWKGYIKFFAPEDPATPLEKAECEVDCGCPDYRYRWAWSNTQRDSSRIGPNSVNQCIDRAPRITNPSNRPGLCKHLLALRSFLYGQDSSFLKSDEVDNPSRRNKIVKDAKARLDALTTRANGQTIDLNGASVTAPPGSVPVERERNLRRRINRRSAGQNPDEEQPEQPAQEPTQEPEQEQPDSTDNGTNDTNPTNQRSSTGDETNDEDSRRESVVNHRTMKSKMIIEAEELAASAAALNTKKTPSDQALAALQSINSLLAQLVELEKAEAEGKIADKDETELPAEDTLPEEPPAEEVPADEQDRPLAKP